MQKHKLYEFDVPLDFFAFTLVLLLALIIVGALTLGVWQTYEGFKSDKTSKKESSTMGDMTPLL